MTIFQRIKLRIDDWLREGRIGAIRLEMEEAFTRKDHAEAAMLCDELKAEIIKRSHQQWARIGRDFQNRDVEL